ncbi:MAG: nicotinamide-nucleotide amidohydrolase family protein [Planctomycetota bacterium]|jgi:nicotinamide-nucleotide amidase
MIKASIVSVGNEVLSGQTVDTNASYLSRRLLSIGIPVVSSYTVADDIDSILRALNLADFFTRRNLQMPESNKIQAYIPSGAKALANNIGTAPGIIADVEGKLLIALPGVPSEMRQMFEESVFAELRKLVSESQQAGMVVRKLKCFGAGESTIAESLGSLCQRGRNPLINCTVEHGVITLHIVATAEDEGKAQQMVYGTGEQTLAEVVGQKLAQQKKTIAVAESCTGGTLAKLITDIAGASNYFTHGWVTYSNKAKNSELGVPMDLIEKYGAVSDQVAEAMARGARQRAGTDIAIGITGIAGPTGGGEQKPVGLVYISVDSNGDCETQRFIMSGDRGLIRLRAAQTALNMLRLRL